jgi:hypothetical protein
MALLTREDLARQSRFAWLCLIALVAMAAWFWSRDKGSASIGTLLSALGCLGLMLPPRERMPALPWRVRALPRWLDGTAPLGALIVSPGYGLSWFYGVNPFDEVVHFVNGALLGAVFAALLLADGVARSPAGLAWRGALFGLVLGVAWEIFEAATGLIGDFTDTWTDIVLGMAGAALAGWAAGPRLRTAVMSHGRAPG